MAIEAIITDLTGTQRIVLYAWLTVSLVHVFSIRRTKVRRFTKPAALILMAALILSNAVLAVLYLKIDDYLNGGFCVANILVLAYAARHFFDDDDWFGKKSKKLKKSLKDFGKRLSNVRLPSLMPAPNPA